MLREEGGGRREEAVEKARECSSTFLNELQDGVLGVDVNHNQCSQRDTCLLW